MSSSRPEWMEGGVKRPKPQPRPFVPESTHERVAVQDATHRNVVVGVTLLALVTLFSLFFWLTIVMLAAINPPGSSQSELTFIRMLVAMVAGAWLTWLAWTIADNAIDA